MLLYLVHSTIYYLNFIQCHHLQLPHLEKIREEKLNILEKVIDNHKITGSQRQKLIDGVMDNTFICNVWEKMKVIRNPKSKWC